MFIRYINKTTKQQRLYALNLGYIITVTIIDFLKSKKSSNLDLQIRKAYLQRTLSDLVDCIIVGKLKETLKIVKLLLKKKLNNFEIRILVKRTNTAVTNKLTAITDNVSFTDYCIDQLTDVANELTNTTDKFTHDANTTATVTAITVTDTQVTKRPASNSQKELDT